MKQSTTVPYGFCHCLCGNKTNICPVNRRVRGQVKGEPMRYLPGHTPSGTAGKPKSGRVRRYHGRVCQCGKSKEGRSRYCRECNVLAARPPEDPKIYIVEGELCRRMPLTQEQYSLVDASEYDRLFALKHHAQFHENGSGGKGSFYGRRKEGRLVYRLANEVLQLPHGIIVDHHNCNSLDNRRSNLRPASVGENGRNHRKSKNNTSGHKGVYFIRKNKWRVVIMHNWVRYNLGYYSTYEEACAVQEEAALRLHGKFARLK